MPASFNNNPSTPSKVKVKLVPDLGRTITEVKFFRENAVVGGVKSTPVHVESSPGPTAETTIDVSDLSDTGFLTTKVPQDSSDSLGFAFFLVQSQNQIPLQQTSRFQAILSQRIRPIEQPLVWSQ